MKILVCGGRNWNDWPKLKAHLDAYANGSAESIHVIEGGAHGADIMGRQWAIGKKVTYTEVPADWKTHGKAAGPIRNRQMLDMAPDVVLAFHVDLAASKGTKDCVEEAKRRGIPVQVIS